MSGIFISYRRSTSQHFARSIFMALQHDGVSLMLRPPPEYHTNL